jgi:serine/threonine-protein kinase
MSLNAGARVGPYEIVGLVGAGGMGEVYRARDTKLNRDVALKVLPASLAGDPDRLARFQREAQVLAALNHPNIAHIHGFEDSGSTHAIVMELVEGPTLADMMAAAAGLAGGAIPLADVLPIARQIAEALEAAHEQGIIHRDLKPANVKVRPDGTVKVLDFGLAKALAPDGASGTAEAINSPTLTARATQLGVILGTAAYMAPEQAKGRTLDRRADIWAFGVVLYEMVTGDRAFKGDDISDTLAAVLRQEIDWKALPQSTPPRLTRLLRRCLDRDVKTRLRDIGEARVELARLESGVADAADVAPAPAAAPVSPPPARPVFPWVAAGLLAGVVLASAAGWAIVHFAAPPKAQPMRFAFVPSTAQPIGMSGQDRFLAVSPQGTHIAYIAAGNGALVVRPIDQLDAQPMPGISGARQPFFSWDGQWIGFFQGATELRKVSITGGPSIPICKITSPPRGASWGPDETIIFGTVDQTTGLLTVPAGGGEPKAITTPDRAHGEFDHWHPSVLPGGQAVLFTITAGPIQPENAQVAVLDLKTGATKTLIRGGSQAEYIAASTGGTGYLVYAAAGTLRAVRFDPRRLEVLSDPVPVVEHVAAVGNGAAEFSVSRAGALVYVPGGLDSQGTVRSLVWIDRKGHEEPIKAAPPRAYFDLRLSPDGTRVALEILDQGNDIWIWHLARETLTPLTLDPARDAFPVWTPDSARVVFASGRDGIANLNLYWQAADGTGQVERLTTADHSQTAMSFSPDSASLLVRENNSATNDDISLLSMSGKRPIAPLIQTPFIERNAEVSRDGKWVAYESYESTPAQIYVRPFPDWNGGHWQISTLATGGGTKPVWAPNSHELFYLGNNALYAVAMPTTPSAAGNPVKLFDLRSVGGLNVARSYDVSRDGKRFIAIKEPTAVETNATSTLQDMVVVVNWIEELKAKVVIK